MNEILEDKNLINKIKNIRYPENFYIKRWTANEGFILIENKIREKYLKNKELDSSKVGFD